jgi:hypothetical protein
VGYDNMGFNPVYELGLTTYQMLLSLKNHTDTGITGEYVDGNSLAATQHNLSRTMSSERIP